MKILEILFMLLRAAVERLRTPGVILGAALGLVAAFRLAPRLGSLLYGVSATAKGTFLVSALLLLAVAIAAAVIPARRAAARLCRSLPPLPTPAFRA
jgi:hypothetical protein